MYIEMHTKQKKKIFYWSLQKIGAQLSLNKKAVSTVYYFIIGNIY